MELHLPGTRAWLLRSHRASPVENSQGPSNKGYQGGSKRDWAIFCRVRGLGWRAASQAEAAKAPSGKPKGVCFRGSEAQGVVGRAPMV